MSSRSRTPWFTLIRFDTPPADPPAGGQPGTGTPPPQDPPKDSPKEPTDAEKLAAAQADVEKWKGLSRKHEERAQSNADKAKKFDELDAANKTEAEKLAAAKDAAEQRAAAAIQRAVRAEVKALASDFADPTDAETAINPADYVDATTGEIDTEAIKTKLTELLTAKPHWRKAAAGTPPPKPDPGQGARGGGTSVSFKDADDKTVHAEMAKYGIRPRS